MKDFFQWLKLRREKRYWEIRHLEFIRRMVIEDMRWLAANPIAKEITERYEKATANDWYKVSHEDVSQFRARIGIDQNRKLRK